jgi:hypothetical protein
MGQQAQNVSEFELARKRLAQKSRAAQQEQQQAIKRQFARSGLLGSGAAIKTIQKGQQQIQEREQLGREQIGAAERTEQRRQREIGEQREFAAKEAEKQREFVKGESALGRLFQKEQSDIQRGFVSGESQKGRDFQRALFDEQQKFQKLKFDEGIRQFAEQLDLSKQQFALEKDVAEFNKQIAQAEANRPTDLLGSLLGPQFSLEPGKGPLGTVAGVVGGGASSIIGGVTGAFCHLPGTEVVMKDGSYKLIEDIKLGEKVFGGGEVNAVAKAYANDKIYEYQGELMTGDHVIFEKGQFIFVKDSEDSMITDLDNKTVVIPLNTDSGFYLTKAGYISVSYMDVEGAINPVHELALINANPAVEKKAKEILTKFNGAEFFIRQLNIVDYKKMRSWFAHHNWAVTPYDQLPRDTSYVILDENDELLGMSSFYKTNSSLALLGFTISAPPYYAERINSAMDELYKYVLEKAREAGHTCLYYATDKNSLKMVKNMEKFGGKVTSNGDGYVMVIPLKEGVNTDSLEDKDFLKEVG